MTLFVTGGAGFIGSNFVLDWLVQSNEPIINLDALTYAGNLKNLIDVENDARHVFIKGNINDSQLLKHIFFQYNPRAIINFAAETHVDRSILDPEEFIQTNILGTFRLLEAARFYYSNMPETQKKHFRFLHISTDEVYGSLGQNSLPFCETNKYEPNSPYSASKAASDHLVRAYYKTYNLPVLTTNCSNNYGPYQFPEKLIPFCIINALSGKQIPLYGDGRHIRDWLYVKDHCSAIRKVLEEGNIGESYNIGGGNEKTNIQVVETLCTILDELKPRKNGLKYLELILFVKDRPGHDRRYAIDSAKLHNELGWKQAETFESGLRKTVSWYLNNYNWLLSLNQNIYCFKHFKEFT